jgi:formate dehydrogenase subunit gamma
MPPPEGPSLSRFDGTERLIHWANAVLFAILLATAAALYVGPISAAVGRREVVKTVHVYSGLLLPFPLLLGYVLPRAGRRFRADLARLNRWSASDRRWLRTRGRDRTVRVGKFNAGQKLNAAFVGGAIAVMLGTGSIMRWPQHFRLSWRTGATFVHDWVAIGLFFAITGHLLFAFSDSEAMAGMVKGRVSRAWARAHHPAWFDEPATRIDEPASPPPERDSARR